MKSIFKVSIFLFFISIATGFAQYNPEVHYRTVGGNEFGVVEKNYNYTPQNFGPLRQANIERYVHVISYKASGTAEVGAGLKVTGTSKTEFWAWYEGSYFTGTRSCTESDNVWAYYCETSLHFMLDHIEGSAYARTIVTW